MYYSDVAALLIELGVAGWVVYNAVLATIHTDIGAYFQYADYSSIGNLMGLFDLIAFFLFPLWSSFVILTALVSAGRTWTMTDERLAEAKAGSIGVETPITTVKAIKVATLNCLSAIAIMIAGLGLAEEAFEMISMFDYYHDKTN